MPRCGVPGRWPQHAGYSAPARCTRGLPCVSNAPRRSSPARPDICGRQLPERDMADRVDDRLKDVPVHRDGLLRPAPQPLGQPRRYRVGQRVPGPGRDLSVQLLTERADLLPYLGLSAPRHGLPDALPARAEAERDDPAPPPGAVPVVLRVASGGVVLEVDGCLALAALHSSMLTRWLPELSPRSWLPRSQCAPDLGGAMGI